MGRPPAGGHIRRLGGHARYRHIRIMVDGKSVQVLEHRNVMEKHLGRKLLREEVVHHKDGDGLNNSIENLQIMSFREHQRHHMMEIGPKQYSIKEAIELRKHGWSVAKIADHLGVASRNVLMAFKARDICTRDLRHGTNRWDVELAKRMFDAGATMKSISRAVGVKPASIRKAFIKRGWLEPPRPRET